MYYINDKPPRFALDLTFAWSSLYVLSVTIPNLKGIYYKQKGNYQFKA